MTPEPPESQLPQPQEPAGPPEQPPVASSAPEAEQPPPGYRWYHRLAAVLFATMCLWVGFFLLIFPWSDYAVDFAAFRPDWRAYWDNAYIRGAISGLGMVNLYIAIIEITALKRFAK